MAKDPRKQAQDIINKFKRTQKYLARRIGEELIKDIEKTSAVGKHVKDGSRKSSPRLKPQTIADYKKEGLRSKARFRRTGKTVSSLKATYRNGILRIRATGGSKHIPKYLASKKTKNNKTKESRHLFGVDKIRVNKVKTIIKKFIKAYFR